MNATGAHQRRSLVAFFILFLVLGAPIVVFANVQVFPNVPLFTFGALLPATTAVILSYWENRSAGVMELLRRSIDFKRVTSRLWYLPILLTWPFLYFCNVDSRSSPDCRFPRRMSLVGCRSQSQSR